MIQKAALPFPLGITMQVFRDDGKWDEYSAWFKRSSMDLRDLFVAKITLGHYDGSDEPAYSHSEWVRKADQLVTEYPGCVFIYG